MLFILSGVSFLLINLVNFNELFLFWTGSF